MFNFGNYTCEFITTRDMWNNFSISVYSDNGIFLYQLTEDVPFPLAEDVVLLKKAPFIYQFLAQMQNEGILIGELTPYSMNGKDFLLGKLKERRRAAEL